MLRSYLKRRCRNNLQLPLAQESSQSACFTDVCARVCVCTPFSLNVKYFVSVSKLKATGLAESLYSYG